LIAAFIPQEPDASCGLRGVKPHIYPGAERPRQCQIVLLQVRDGHVAFERRSRLEHSADLLLAALVVRMRLAREHHLERPRHAGNSPQSVRIGEQQVGPLVRRDPAREPERQRVRIESRAGPPFHLRQQVALARGVRGEDFDRREADGVAKIEIVSPPLPEVPVIQRAERVGRPGEGVDPVGDRVDRVVREHAARDFPVPHRHSVDVMGESQRQPGHVQDLIDPSVPGEQHGRR
jgi:hypothetical protein